MPDLTVSSLQLSISGRFHKRYCRPRSSERNLRYAGSEGHQLSEVAAVQRQVSNLTGFNECAERGRLCFDLRDLCSNQHRFLALAERQLEVDNWIAPNCDRDASMYNGLKSRLAA
jgi:hypothetical protein